MFNVTIRQVGIEEREEIIICCHEISDEVMSLANSIKGQKKFSSCIKRRRDVQA